MVKMMWSKLKTKHKNNWLSLESVEQWQQILKDSKAFPEKRVVVFKHSTRCSISSMAKNRLEVADSSEWPSFYYLDLLAYRPVSDRIAEDTGITHESPQLLILQGGECIFSSTHTAIDPQDIVSKV